MWTVGRWIVSTGIRLLLLIHSFISSFVFLSNFQALKVFIALFTGTVRPRKLKLGTHMNNGWMYHVYQNPTVATYLSLYFFIFLSLQFQALNIFVGVFMGTMRSRRLKLRTNMNSGWLYCVYRNQAAAAYSSS